MAQIGWIEKHSEAVFRILHNTRQDFHRNLMSVSGGAGLTFGAAGGAIIRYESHTKGIELLVFLEALTMGLL